MDQYHYALINPMQQSTSSTSFWLRIEVYVVTMQALFTNIPTGLALSGKCQQAHTCSWRSQLSMCRLQVWNHTATTRMHGTSDWTFGDFGEKDTVWLPGWPTTYVHRDAPVDADGDALAHSVRICDRDLHLLATKSFVKYSCAHSNMFISFPRTRANSLSIRFYMMIKIIALQCIVSVYMVNPARQQTRN